MERFIFRFLAFFLVVLESMDVVKMSEMINKIFANNLQFMLFDKRFSLLLCLFTFEPKDGINLFIFEVGTK